MESMQVIKSHNMTIIPLLLLRLYKQPFWGKQIKCVMAMGNIHNWGRVPRQ